MAAAATAVASMGLSLWAKIGAVAPGLCPGPGLCSWCNRSPWGPGAVYWDFGSAESRCDVGGLGFVLLLGFVTRRHKFYLGVKVVGMLEEISRVSGGGLWGV